MTAFEIQVDKQIQAWPGLEKDRWTWDHCWILEDKHWKDMCPEEQQLVAEAYWKWSLL